MKYYSNLKVKPKQASAARDVSARMGFSLAEIIVVIGIIGILAGVVSVGLMEARKKARDSRRVSDLSQIELALRIYKETYNHYPSEADGFSGIGGDGTICSGCVGPINDVLEKHLGGSPEDPMHGASHWYFYDAQHKCDSLGNQAVLMAIGLERPEGRSNWEEIKILCGGTDSSFGGEGRGGHTDDGYYILLGDSPDG